MFCPYCGYTIDGEMKMKYCPACGADIGTVRTDPGTPQPVGARAEVRYAGFWRRFAAYLIDLILMSVAGFVIGFMVGVFVGSTGDAEDGEGLAAANIAASVISVIVNWLYWALTECSSWQATLGKKALGIIVTDYEGRRISFGRATGRYWAKLLSAVIVLIGYFMIAFTAKKQGLHDNISECLVVVKR